MSDWRLCELEALGATVLDAGISPGDPVEAELDGVRLLWTWDGLHLARAEGFDRWAVSRVATVPAADRHDVLRAIRAWEGRARSG